MPITCYDSTNPFDIPQTAEMVAGYIDGIYAWSAAGWGRFIGSQQWKIAVSAATNNGNVLDVETGDATPSEATAWVVMRRLAGIDSIVYVQQSRWLEVKLIFAARGIPQPHYWIANYDGNPTIPAGAIAKQYANQAIIPGHPHYDLSVVDETFGGGGGSISGVDIYHRTVTVVMAAGSLHQFCRGTDNALYHRKVTAGSFGAWASLGGTLIADVISAGVDEAGVLRVTVAGNGGFFDISSADDGATWSAYSGPHGQGTGLLTLGATAAPAPSQTVTGTFTGKLA